MNIDYILCDPFKVPAIIDQKEGGLSAVLVFYLNRPDGNTI